MKKATEESDSESEEEPVVKQQAKAGTGSCSIKTGPTIVATCVGPIGEWLAVPENLPNHPVFAMYGKRRTGKSTTITNIVQKCMLHIPFGIVMTGTAFAGYWKEIVPGNLIVQGLRTDVIDWLVQRQMKAVAKYGIEDKRIHAFVIFDDVISDQHTLRYNDDIAKFFVMGRHLGITVFIASQYLKVRCVSRAPVAH